MWLEDRAEKATYRILPVGLGLREGPVMSVDAVNCFLALRPGTKPWKE